MKPKVIAKLLCDVLTAAWLLLMAYEMAGEAAHEWIGLGMFLLFLIHHILNISWCRHICKGKYTAWVLLAPHGTRVNIVQDGTVLYSFDLAEAKDQTLVIEYEGRRNIVQIENGRIRMLEAECPDKTCVHMGWLSSRAMPIVCLPNHLSIEYAGTEDDVDAVIR